jgi:hypothetical protein
VTITVTPVPDPANMRVVVNVTASPAISAPIVVYRVHEDGSEHPLSTVDLTPDLIGGAWSGIDRHPPLNAPVTYRASTYAETGTSNPTVLWAAGSWLVHPSDPDLTVQVDGIRSVTGRGNDSSAVAVHVLDRTNEWGERVLTHIQDQPRSAESGSLALKVDTHAQRDALRHLFASGGRVLAVTPYEDIPWLWIQPGRVSYDPIRPVGYLPPWIVTIPYESAAEPGFAEDPAWTNDQLAAEAVVRGWTNSNLGTVFQSNDYLALNIRSS